MHYLAGYWGLHLTLAIVSFLMVFGSVVGGMYLSNSERGDSAPFVGIGGAVVFFVSAWVNGILAVVGIVSNFMGR